MNISGINFESIVDGEGVRVVVFVSGCAHDCKGCHNPASHSFTAGQPFTKELQEEIISYIQKTPFISGITMSGGDPMYSAIEVAEFLQILKQQVPNISVWIYSGFTYEEAISDPNMLAALKLCDVLVDGEFILEQRDMTLSYRGSKNQRVIDVKKSQKQKEVVLFE